MKEQKRCCICGGELEERGGAPPYPLIMKGEISGEGKPECCLSCSRSAVKARFYLSNMTDCLSVAETARFLLEWRKMPVSLRAETVNRAFPDMETDSDSFPDDGEE